MAIYGSEICPAYVQNKIENVVGGLLDFSRKPEIEFSEVNLKDIIENILRMTTYHFEKSRIAISKNFAIHPARGLKQCKTASLPPLLAIRATFQ